MVHEVSFWEWRLAIWQRHLLLVLALEVVLDLIFDALVKVEIATLEPLDLDWVILVVTEAVALVVVVFWDLLSDLA